MCLLVIPPAWGVPGSGSTHPHPSRSGPGLVQTSKNPIIPSAWSPSPPGEGLRVRHSKRRCVCLEDVSLQRKKSESHLRGPLGLRDRASGGWECQRMRDGGTGEEAGRLAPNQRQSGGKVRELPPLHFLPAVGARSAGRAAVSRAGPGPTTHAPWRWSHIVTNTPHSPRGSVLAPTASTATA